MKKFILIFAAAIIAYLLLWPVPIDPVAWDAPKAPSLEGEYALNDKLAAVKLIAEGEGIGPEDVVVDSDGRLYCGYEDGRIMSFDINGENPRLIADTGGRPLGLVFDNEGRLIVGDGYKGLLRIDNTGAIEVLSTEADGVPFRFTNNADVAADGTIYFTDASSRFGPKMHARDDIMEHGGNGRFMKYDPETGETRVLLSGLQFANGVAVDPGQRFVLVAETGNYTIVRYWIKGPRAGEHELFYENLPGIPDNITSNRRDTFWVALYSPRMGILDAFSGFPFMRKVAYRLPQFLQPRPASHAFVLGLSHEGEVKYNLQYTGRNSYHPITGVYEHDGKLFLGSLTQPAIGVYELKR